MNTDQLYLEQDRVLSVVFEHRAAIVGSASMLLAGGTALARYYLHHRVSYDLDFFISQGFDPALLRSRLERLGLATLDYSEQPGGLYVAQLHGYLPTETGDLLKVSFVEDIYAGSFPLVEMSGGIVTETVEGLYHRKLRTLTGSGTAQTGTGHTANQGARQTARDVFDLYVLSCQVKPMPAFIQAINEHGANVPIDALERGLRTLPWMDLMDEYDRLERMPEYQDLTLFDIKRYFDANPIL